MSEHQASTLVDAERDSSPPASDAFAQPKVMLKRNLKRPSGEIIRKLPLIVPITDLRHDAAAVLERVRASGEPVVITQRGRAAAELSSPEVYERSEQEREILRRLARGELEIREDRGVDLDDVLAEGARILESGS